MEEIFAIIFAIFAIVFTFALVAFAIYLPYSLGKIGINPIGHGRAYDEKVIFNTDETTKDVVARGLKGLLIWLGAEAVMVFSGITGSTKEQIRLEDIFNLNSNMPLLVLLLPSIVAYIAGVVEAYNAAKERRDKGVDSLRDLLYASRSLVLNELHTFQYFHVETYPKLYYGAVVDDSKYFFKDAKEGDLVYFFRQPINKFRLGKTSSYIVIYRKKDNKIINVGTSGDAIIGIVRSTLRVQDDKADTFSKEK